jgi:hypothetical protein
VHNSTTVCVLYWGVHVSAGVIWWAGCGGGVHPPACMLQHGCLLFFSPPERWQVRWGLLFFLSLETWQVAGYWFCYATREVAGVLGVLYVTGRGGVLVLELGGVVLLVANRTGGLKQPGGSIQGLFVCASEAGGCAGLLCHGLEQTV